MVQPFTGNVVYKSWLLNLQLKKREDKETFPITRPNVIISSEVHSLIPVTLLKPISKSLGGS